MARARLLKPGFFTNEVMSGLPKGARLLFLGLLTVADREGRLEDRPPRIRAEILPYDKVNIDRLLGMLHDAGFIQRYEASDGRRCIQIVKFGAHQSPHIREPASTIPAPVEHGASTSQAPAKHQPSTASRARASDPVTDPVAEAEADPGHGGSAPASPVRRAARASPAAGGAAAASSDISIPFLRSAPLDVMAMCELHLERPPRTEELPVLQRIKATYAVEVITDAFARANKQGGKTVQYVEAILKGQKNDVGPATPGAPATDPTSYIKSRIRSG